MIFLGFLVPGDGDFTRVLGPQMVSLVREMGPRLFQGNRSVGEIFFHLASMMYDMYDP